MAIHVGVVLGDPRLPYPYAVDGKFGAQELAAVEHLQEALGGLQGYRFSYFDDHARLLDALRESRPQLVLNLCDTGYRNVWEQERNIPALLEILEIPYTGSDAAAIVLSNDKALVSAAARLRGVEVPEQQFVDLASAERSLPTRFPAIIKPNVSCGSLGISDRSVVHDEAQAEACLRWLQPQLDVPEALIQEYLPGAEYTVGVLGNPGAGFQVLPPLEVDFSGLDPTLPKLLTHASKADEQSPYWTQVTFRRAELQPDAFAVMERACERMFSRLGFRDYARFDFRCDASGVPRLIDANVNPTWYREAKMALMASWAGHSYAEMLQLILQAAMARSGLAA
jgi:D-alanine-D-alanine ligase